MPVPTAFSDLSTTAASNSPPGTESAKGNVDDYLRAGFAFDKQLYDASRSSSYTWLGTAGGTVDALTFTPSPAFTAYAAGQTFRFISSGANTTNATININGLGAKAITKNGTTALAVGDIPSGAVCEVVYDGTQFQLLNVTPNNINATSLNGGQLAGLRNKVINGNFGVNQRAVSGTVTLAAGAYGHDRWKAGASGCTYTFATVENVTTITISAGSLQQVIEGNNLQSGTHVLSWSGTAQGRINAGSYGASGVTGTATGGTNLTVEFGTGTVSKVQLEPGTVATPFEHRLIELDLCQRYARPMFASGAAVSSTTFVGYQNINSMRAVPTVTLTSASNDAVGPLSSISVVNTNNSTVDTLRVVVTHTSSGAKGDPCYALGFLSSEL